MGRDSPSISKDMILHNEVYIGQGKHYIEVHVSNEKLIKRMFRVRENFGNVAGYR